MSTPGHLKYRRRRQRRLVRRCLLVLLGALVVTGVLSWAIRLFDQSDSALPPAPPIPEDASVQFK